MPVRAMKLTRAGHGRYVPNQNCSLGRAGEVTGSVSMKPLKKIAAFRKAT